MQFLAKISSVTNIQCKLPLQSFIGSGPGLGEWGGTEVAFALRTELPRFDSWHFYPKFSDVRVLMNCGIKMLILFKTKASIRPCVSSRTVKNAGRDSKHFAGRLE